MIIFDYGHTLLFEPGFAPLRGEEALFEYVTKNRNNLTAKEVSDFAQALFAELGAARANGLEIHEMQFQRLLYEYLEIELSISLSEAERIFWNGASAGEIMPGADRMISYINSRKIRSGVISNIGFSGAALTERLCRLLPENRFEFMIASSEYALRKPNPILFELALKKAGLCASDVWFCGDNFKADIEGASSVGIFPVWYEDTTVVNPNRPAVPGSTHVRDYLHIHKWSEFIRVLEECE